MSTQVELLIALLSLLAGVLFAWVAVAGCGPWRLGAGCGRRGATEREFRDTKPGSHIHGTDNPNNQHVK